MRIALLTLIALTGCASSPEFVASKSDVTVCRFTMGGPHASNADAEARRRGLNCLAMYPAIQAQMANENAATANLLRTLQPAPMLIPAAPTVNCTSQRLGTTVHTSCN